MSIYLVFYLWTLSAGPYFPGMSEEVPQRFAMANVIPPNFNMSK
jgi:hypothetical protein